ncbi:MAG TPA: hypothetical protein VGC69_04700 [Bordetella sp.]
MALISCPECARQISDKAAACPSCGCPISVSEKMQQSTAAMNAPVQTVTLSKSRGVYIILGLLFGYLGFHNFYAGQHGRGAIKLILLLVTVVLDGATGFHTGFSLIVIVLTTIWSLLEILFVTRDAAGNVFS